MSQTLALIAVLPILGTRKYTFPIPDNAVLDELEKLDGGTLSASATVTETAAGAQLTAGLILPVVGEKSIYETIPFDGVEQTAIDELLSLNGGSISLNVTLEDS